MNHTDVTREWLAEPPADPMKEVVDRLRMIGRFGDHLEAGDVDVAHALLLARCLLEKAEALAA